MIALIFRDDMLDIFYRLFIVIGGINAIAFTSIYALPTITLPGGWFLSMRDTGTAPLRVRAR